MVRLLNVILVGVIVLGLVGCRQSTTGEQKPPGAAVEPPEMQLQAPAPRGGGQGGSPQVPVRRPPR
ncbi:MAG: hypothetical protein IMHGJWDQ_001502 [Candidatus Fervidibacter sp.]